MLNPTTVDADHTHVKMLGPLRRMALAAALVLSLTACGDLLSGVGDLSEGVVHGDRTTTTTAPEVGGPVLRLSPITELVWMNDGLGAATAGLDADSILLSVWLRGEEGESAIQSSRREITDVLPGLEFPQLAPGGVTHVSSQLVFDTQTASLGVGTAAAFGLWVGEPYTAARSEAQLAILRVGLKTFDDGTLDNEVFSFSVADGRELSWIDGDYVYQLFCRTGVSIEACQAMAESTIPLSLLVGLPGPTG
jgi:hypothetical protein